jgi:acetyl esterase
MKTRLHFFVCFLIILLAGCQRESPSAQISGIIKGNSEARLWIDDQQMELSSTGEFFFSKALDQYTLIDASYGELEYTIFLNPGARVEMLISENDPTSIDYQGDLHACNSYLLGISSLSDEINTSINQNWMQLHNLNQQNFVAEMDSMKGLYLEDLDKDPNRENFAPEFLDAWKAEIDYGFNTLILRYPERYIQFPPEAFPLNEATLDYLTSSDPDRIEYFNLPAYRNYTKAWLDYSSTLQAENDPAEKHFGLKRMDYLFQLISSSFETPFLKDYWMGEYLMEFMEECGLSNSQPYLDLFFHSALSEPVIAEVIKTRVSLEDSQKDHSVKVYKQENNFKLEAHIFTPKENSIKKQAGIVIFHGGGWNSGNPSWGYGRARHYAEQGMLAIAAQYRLTNEHDITAVESMADARDMVIWLRTHADSLHLDPDKIVGYGWSAGAHLISSAAIFPSDDQETGLSSSPDALVLLSPAVSLPKGEGWKYWNYNVLGTKATVDEVDPVEHVRDGLPPTLILQGRDDTVTPLEGVKLFSDRMKKQGNHCELWVYEDVGHLFTPNYLPDNGWPRPDPEVQKKAFKQIDVFLQEQGYLK